MRSTRLVAVLLAVGVIAGCGGGGDGDDDAASNGGAKLQAAGEVDVDVDDAGASGSTTTIPLDEAEEGPAIVRLGSAWTAFRECIKEAGFGDEPLPTGENGTADLDPAYTEALGRCNNETGIVDAFQAFQAEGENLDPEQIELQNVGLIAFRECILRRGWEMGELEPNENGALFPTSGAPEPPEGRDSQRDYQECAKSATDAATEAAEEKDADAEENG